MNVSALLASYSVRSSCSLPSPSVILSKGLFQSINMAARWELLIYIKARARASHVFLFLLVADFWSGHFFACRWFCAEWGVQSNICWCSKTVASGTLDRPAVEVTAGRTYEEVLGKLLLMFCSTAAICLAKSANKSLHLCNRDIFCENLQEGCPLIKFNL